MVFAKIYGILFQNFKGIWDTGTPLPVPLFFFHSSDLQLISDQKKKLSNIFNSYQICFIMHIRIL